VADSLCRRLATAVNKSFAVTCPPEWPTGCTVVAGRFRRLESRSTPTT